jgi:hypothetical protein
MKNIIVVIFCFALVGGYAQEIQLHYDFRHTMDPQANPKNFPMMVFKYFKPLDTLGTGSFLFEAQTFFNGDRSNIGQTFIQASQTIKFWKPRIYLAVNYSGGLGIAPPSYGYYIGNAYGIGVSTNLIFSTTWFAFNLGYRYSGTLKPSNDIQFNVYVGGGLFNYRLMYSCSLVTWATDKDNGLPQNEGKAGKKISFFADPQLWYGIGKKFSIGTRISLYYHVLNEENDVQAYPTLGVKRGFD